MPPSDILAGGALDSVLTRLASDAVCAAGASALRLVRADEDFRLLDAQCLYSFSSSSPHSITY
jgi:hypothetical protein